MKEERVYFTAETLYLRRQMMSPNLYIFGEIDVLWK